MPSDSISALRACMEFLSLDPNEARSHDVQARITLERPKASAGGIAVTFQSNWHSGDGPYLDFGDEIKGYGVRYAQFKPKWVNITWSSADTSLRIEGSEYDFTLKFK